MLGAGLGTRLLPLTRVRPKPLCPVGGVALVDHGLTRARRALGADADVAVNVHHGRDAMVAHLADRGVHLSVEEVEPLGTAGAVGALRPWLDGRPVLVLNGDTWCPGDLGPLVASWDRERPRVVVAGPPRFGPRSRIVASLLPATDAAALVARPSGLYERCWAPAAVAGRLDVVGWDGPLLDCGTPADYLAANLAAIGGDAVVGAGATVAGAAVASVVGEGAVVEGRVVRSVLWEGTRVAPGEVLVDAVRASSRVTVLVRPPGAARAEAPS